MKQIELKALLDSLTLEEKIGQLVQLNGNFFDTREEIATGPIAKVGVSGDLLYKTGSILNTFGAKTLKDLQDRYIERNDKKIPMLFMADIINGFRTVFPISLGLGCSFDPELVKRTAQIAAHEASVSGVHITFSPMVDLVRDARWGRVMESYGEDIYLNCAFAKAMVEGYQNNEVHNIFACVKHFAGYGAPLGGREYNTVEMGERALRESYLPSYKAAVDAGCRLVMTSFNTLDGIPATANAWLLRDVLRKEWGFTGTVISDHSAVKELIAHGVAEDERDASKQAIEAGCDIDMMTSAYANNLQVLVESGDLDIKYIDEACMHVLELKNDLGLFENAYRNANEDDEKTVILCDEYRAIAQDAVSKTCVLLQNKNALLPLAKDCKLALIGPYADYQGIFGMWSFATDPNSVVTVKKGFENFTNTIMPYAKGSGFMDEEGDVQSFGGMNLKMTSDDSEAELTQAISLAKQHDVIVLALGEHAQQSGEGGARGHLTLPDVQMKLLFEMKKLNKPIIVLLFSGRPLEVKEIEANCDALLQCWFPGIEGGNGIAKLIYGDVNPSARLSMSFPHSVGQCPVFYNELSTGRPASTSKHSKRFTSRYIDMPNTPYHCFGYGLSYSEFTYTNLRLSNDTLDPNGRIIASIDICNNSDVDGYECVQLYIRDLVASVARPIKELKGVQKIPLKAHESKTINFEIKEDMLRFVGRDMQYISEAGTFQVMIGKNCEDVLTTSFQFMK